MPRDDGSVQVLESVIVACLFLSAATFVVTFDQPQGSDGATRTGLRAQADDALRILLETPAKGGIGDSLLASYAASCLQGSCDAMRAKLDALLPQGVAYGVYISNGVEMVPLLEARPPEGEAVTARVSLEPGWSATMLVAAIPSVNPASDAVVLHALPLFHGNALTSEGTPVLVTMRGTRLTDGASYVVQGAASTRAAALAEPAPHVAASLAFVDVAGAPLATLEARATTLSGSNPSNAPLPLRLRLSETGGGTIPAGARLVVDLPPGWTANATPASNADWVVASNATDPRGSQIVAHLARSVASGHADLRLDARYSGDANDYYAIRAQLSGGAGAAAALLVRADGKQGQPTFEVPTLTIGAPRPLGIGAPGTWTVSAHLPAPLPGVPAEAVRVEEITIRSDSGEPLFATVSGVAGAGGEWSVMDGALRWTGAHVMTHETPLALVVNATGLAVAKPSPERAAYAPEAQLDAGRARLVDQVSPGLHRAAIAPGDRGYNRSTGGGLAATHVAVATAPYRATALPGETTYSTGLFAPLQDALHGSVVAVEERVVPAGGTARVRVEAQTVMYSLASLGATPVVRLHVYPPWSGDERIPLHSQLLADAMVGADGTYLAAIDSDGDGRPDSPGAGIFQAEIPVPRGSLFGAYLVEAEVSWNEVVSTTIGGSLVQQTFARTARAYDYYVVAPPSLVSPPVPVYEVHLVAWLQDWG